MSNVTRPDQFPSPPGINENSSNPPRQVIVFLYDELVAATNNFNNQIGKGGNGIVYEGKIESTGQSIAVKRMSNAPNNGFQKEAQMIPCLDHPNVIKLVGCCIQGERRLLVYELMPLRSLRTHLHDFDKPWVSDPKLLDWNTRMEIAHGVAQALDYLHNEARPGPVVHRDLKPGNILLDDDLHPKISDFGLAEYWSADFRNDSAKRTRGYSPPEFTSSLEVTTKYDVYSFGVCLLELVTGLKAFDDNKRKQGLYRLPDWVRDRLERGEGGLSLADPRLNGEFPEKIFRSVIEEGLKCTAYIAESRPSMKEVLNSMDCFKSQKYEKRVHDDHPVSAKRDYPKWFSSEQIAIATDNFNPKLITRECSFGPVYKGELDAINQKVAVKVLNIHGAKGRNELRTEVLMLNRLRHPNISNRIGHSIEHVNQSLVYEFMPLGSLHNHLHDIDKPTSEMEPLDWNKRMVIAHGVAKALDYLHNKARPPVIYMNLQANNILLNEGFEPKISDFGIAICVRDQAKNSSTSTESVTVRHAYSAPECSNKEKITRKCDVYSFGVVLMELITGLKAFDDKRENGKHHLPDWVRHSTAQAVKLADPRLNGEFDEAIFCRVMKSALECTKEKDPDSRPSMTDVVGYMDEFKSTKYKSRKEGVEREFDFDLNTIPNEEAIT